MKLWPVNQTKKAESPPFNTFEKALEPVTLDQLWRRAELLGVVTVDKGWLRGDPYKVRIKLERATGSTVWAQGVNSDIAFAMVDALKEAEALK